MLGAQAFPDDHSGNTTDLNVTAPNSVRSSLASLDIDADGDPLAASMSLDGSTLSNFEIISNLHDDEVMQLLLELDDVYDLATMTDESDPYRNPPTWSYPFIEGEGIPPAQETTVPAKKTKAVTAQKLNPFDQLVGAAAEQFGSSNKAIEYRKEIETQSKREYLFAR